MTTPLAVGSAPSMRASSAPPLFRAREATYNLLPDSTRDGYFAEILVDLIQSRPGPQTVVDIGCGGGIGTSAALLQDVRAVSHRLIGVEPDASVEPAPGAFDALHRSTFEDSEIADGSVDVAFSCMVMEHVGNPAGFMDRLRRALRPGGSYIFMTVNGAHYFTLLSNALRRAGIDEIVLRAVRGNRAVEGYHYPTAYRFNDPATITRYCDLVGMCAPRFVFAEHEGAKCYFPGPSKAAWHALTLKRRLFRRPDLLLQMIGLVERP